MTGSCRYLESYNVPVLMKRKCQSSSNTTSSNSDEDKQKKSHTVQISEGMCCCRPTSRSDFLPLLTTQEVLLRISHSFLWTSDSLSLSAVSQMPVPYLQLLFSVLFGRTNLIEGSVSYFCFGWSSQKDQWPRHCGSGHFDAPTSAKQTRKCGVHYQPM